MNTFVIFNASIVFLFGLIIGLSELLSRYPETKYIFGSTKWYSFSYITFNGLISTLAIFVLWNLKNKELELIDSIDYSSIFLAGFGGMAILRSSFFSIDVKGQKVDVGFAQIIKIFLTVIDRKISNTIGPKKLKEIALIVDDYDFEKLKHGIVTLSTTFTNHFTNVEAESLQKLIDDLSTDSVLTNRIKMLKLGSEISKYCDAEMLKVVLNVLNLSNNKQEEVIEDLDLYINKLEEHGK